MMHKKQREAIEKLKNKFRFDPSVVSDVVEYPPCPVCNGLGMVYKTLDVNHPDFAKIVECPEECDAVLDNRANQTERLISGMEKWTKRRDRHFDIDFAGYQQMHLSPTRGIALQVAQEFVGHLYVSIDGVAKSSLFFTGGTGTGKTSLASAMVTELERKGDRVFFSRVAEIIKSVQSCYAYDATYSAEQMKDFYAQCPILAMDEFDMHGLTDDKKQIIEDIVDYRYRVQLPTIGTTNLNHDQLRERWGDRTADRLIHMAHWFEISGKLRNQNIVFNPRG